MIHAGQWPTSLFIRVIIYMYNPTLQLAGFDNRLKNRPKKFRKVEMMVGKIFKRICTKL